MMKKLHMQSPCCMLGTVLITHGAFFHSLPPAGFRQDLQKTWSQKKMTVHFLNYIQHKNNYTWQNLKACMHFEIKIASFLMCHCKIQNSFIKAELFTFLFLLLWYLENIFSRPVLTNLDLSTITQQGRGPCTHFVDKTSEVWRNHPTVPPYFLDFNISGIKIIL